MLIPDRELTAERLASELQRLCAGRGKLLAMAERARLLAKPRAADELAASCLALARRRRMSGERQQLAAKPRASSGASRPSGATACAASTPSTSSASAAAA